MRSVAALVSLCAGLVAASEAASAADAPQWKDWTLTWQDNFIGDAGSAPDSSKWNVIVDDAPQNHEWEKYRNANRNVQLSGGKSLQIVPWRDGNTWTSARLESKYTFAPKAGELTAAAAYISFGNDANKQGIWPAFWLLGSNFHSAGWPACGEVDVMEMVNGQLTGYSTLHCKAGCNGWNEGIQGSIPIPNFGWHLWHVEWDRRPSNWQDETIKFFMDDQVIKTVSGAQVGNYDSWRSICGNTMYLILNVAVGGDWVGLHPPFCHTCIFVVG
jgi:beta-glucanase (GH16 family)